MRIDPAPGVPRTISEALGDELTESHLTVASYGGVGGESTPMHHGHGGKKDEGQIDAERFFRAIDRAVLKHHFPAIGPALDPGGAAGASTSFPPDQPESVSNGGGNHDESRCSVDR